MRWLRLYSDSIHHPKLLKLSDRMHRTWIGLLCIASENDGRLPSIEDCALLLRLPPERMAESLVALVGARLLDRDETGVSIHNWASRQFRSDGSAERMKRHRKRHRDVTVTPPDTESESEVRGLLSVLLSCLLSDSSAVLLWCLLSFCF